jgi:hypothetical protein
VKQAVKEKKEISQAKQPNAGWEKTKAVFRKIGRVFQIIGKVLFHLRKIFLAVPVVWAAFKVYAYGQANLPEAVGVWLLENGDYQFTLARESALMSCMAVTAACLVLMFCSRRTILPWIVSIFTLVLPFLLIITNMYPS